MIKEVQNTFNSIIHCMRCSLFGHKSSNKSIIAYSIDAKYMYAAIRLYKVSKCVRCGSIICEKIDSYEKFGWYSQYLADTEKKALSEKGVISIVEAYQKIEKGEK